MARKPRALRPGDLIGVAAPAGPVEEDRLARGVAELEKLGLAVRVADGARERKGFTAGTVENRLRQLHDLFADPAVAAIACARGGAGTIQLLPGLDRELLRAVAATGKDPWLDEDEDDSSCEPLPEVVGLGRPRG